jgi:transposase
VFIRRLKNRSGSTSVQVIQKINGRYKVLKTIGCATLLHDIEKLELLARQEIERLTYQPKLFVSEQDELIDKTLSTLENSDIRTIGPEIIFGKIYDSIGFNKVGEDMFRHLVISRLVFPLSKLKTVEYLQRFQGIKISIDSIYRFLDKLNDKLKIQVEQIAYNHTLKVLKGNINVVFYDMTTLYFESSDEDDLRKTGFSKDGKHQNPQIFIGLLVGLEGYAIGYDIYEGNIYEGHTLIPFIQKISEKFKIEKPIIVADAGLLSKNNIKSLEENQYEYILGGRLKNESNQIKEMILADQYSDGVLKSYQKTEKSRVIVHYSDNRAKKDEYNRTRGLMRLEKKIKAGKLTKSSINNKGYNKYLKLTGEVEITIDYNKYQQDNVWDGLKGYVTNTKLTDKEVLENYRHLWNIEKAFRMSKTDLRIRPIYHRLQRRIEAHICISFTAYCIYKELERVLYEKKSTISLRQAAELTHTIYQLKYTLPESKLEKSILLKMDEMQTELCQIIDENF